MVERSSLFGIEPVVKRTYTKSGKYSKAAAKPKGKRRKGLHYHKGEENTSFLSLAGYADGRKSIDGLVGVIQNQMQLDVL